MVLPLKSLEVVDGILPSDVIIRVHILSDLTECHLARLQLQIGSLPQLIVARLHLLDRLIRYLLILLLKVEQFVPEDEQLAHFGSVFHGQLLHNFLLVLHLFFELLNEAVVLGSHTSDLFVLVLYEALQSGRVTVAKNQSSGVS